jgi:uncharacterized protein YbjQ (UPF0145 family)
MKSRLFLLLAPAVVLIAGCTHRTSVSVDPVIGLSSAPASQYSRVKAPPGEIVITEGALDGQKYISLGNITAAVSKATVFNQMPDRSMINVRLRQEASKMGADAVILVRYGQPGISLFSWGKLEGRGRAVRFVD